MRWPVSTRHLLPPRLPRAAMSIFASIGERVVRDRKFPDAVRTFRGNRRDESSSPNSPAKRTTVRLAKTNCRSNESFNYGFRILIADYGNKQYLGGSICFISGGAPAGRFSKTKIPSASIN